MGTGGYLESLRRLAVGSFESQNALASKEISSEQGRAILNEKVVPLRSALPGMPEIEVNELVAKGIRHGQPPSWEELTRGSAFSWLSDRESRYVKLVSDGGLVAIVTVKDRERVGRGRIKIERVFSQ